jgi:hypothetical protein
MADNDKVQPFEIQEEIVVETPVPTNPAEPTKRVTPIRRGEPLKETHGMAVEANRFKET